MAEDKKKDKEVKRLVVEKIPMQEVRRVTDNDGNEIDLLTIDEALTIILEKVTKLERVL